jgi:hypothetical protein
VLWQRRSSFASKAAKQIGLTTLPNVLAALIALFDDAQST